LRASSWPGNIRELRNYLERHLLFQDLDPEPAAAALDDSDYSDDSDAAAAGNSGMIRVPTDVPFSTARQTILSEFERIYVRDLLDAHDGVVSRAATEAGITRTYLYRLLQRHSRESACSEPGGDTDERPPGDSPDDHAAP
jgi:DNA-binding NtrC family response regulator